MKLKKVRIVLGFSLLMVSFQNCNSPNTMNTQTTSKDGSKSSASTSLGSGSAGAGGSSGSGLSSGSARGITGGGSSSGGSFGGVSGGSAGSISGGKGASSGSGGSGSGTCLGCGSGSGGSGGGSGGGGIIGGGGDTAFKIVTQPSSKTIAENTEFFVGVTIQGGRSPYTFKWYRDGVEIPAKYGVDHYESYSDVLDRIYKEGDYHVVVTDGSGAKLTSNRAQIRMISKLCARGNYFMDLQVRTNTSDGYHYFNDLFYYKTNKYLVSQHNPTIAMMQLQNFLSNVGRMGFGYFTLGGDVSNNQNFSIACSTDVPTIHTSECATNNQSKCYYRGDFDNVNQTYEGSINFLCRNGYIQFVSNTCRLVTPPPSDNGGG